MTLKKAMLMFERSHNILFPADHVKLSMKIDNSSEYPIMEHHIIVFWESKGNMRILYKGEIEKIINILIQDAEWKKEEILSKICIDKLF